MKLLSSISNSRPSSPLCLAALSFIFSTTILKLSFLKYQGIGPIIGEQARIPQEGDREHLAAEKNIGIPFAVGRMEGCDVFSGRWVYDEASRPLYTERQCHSIDPMTNCRAYGRPDTAYLHWRWQPHGCSLPTYDGGRSTEWGGKLGGSCYGETTPIFDPTYWSSASSKRIMQVVREVLGSSKVPITILNITQLSAYRKDAHVSIYKKQPYNLTQEQLANPISYADCNHWCLPGFQDTWNELFYTKLFFP
ncbi:hypothetical protein COCNU_04G013300 [Cocos nucifera]|uniref:Trichome birefringence-like N-terminal domain-containing protein n=1 Tax=Cocos nucifera TaxID=13894 RepID=A0A8K0I7G6_COCNU|nr:hypothetical protein COCNU_04G013300 [Cocos nucifera]